MGGGGCLGGLSEGRRVGAEIFEMKDKRPIGHALALQERNPLSEDLIGSQG